MTTRSPRMRAEFDISRAFTTVRAFKVSGQELQPGQPFDKGLVTQRRLRQLYDARYVTMGEGVQQVPSVKQRPTRLPASPEAVSEPTSPALSPTKPSVSRQRVRLER